MPSALPQSHLNPRPGDSRLHLAWVVPGRLDQLTGGYLYDARVIRGLHDRGHDVRVLELPQRGGPIDPRPTLLLARALAGQPWDAIVVDELAHPAMVLGLPVLRLTEAGRSAAVVVLVHHLRCSEPLSGAARRWAAAIERAALIEIDLAVCTSSTTAAEVERLIRPGTPAVGVPPGCDLHLARPSAGAAGAVGTAAVRIPAPRGERPARPDSPSRCGSDGLGMLMVAHWPPRKGILEALGALALAPRQVSLDLVGDPDRDPSHARRVRAELRRPELAGRVRVHGRVSSERLATLYGQADGLLLASSYEGYGTVLAEGIVAGLPIVATRVGAVPEVVRDGREAELVGVGDGAGLARALERLARDPAERRRRASWARERAASLPTWEECCAAFAGVLERAAFGRGDSSGRDGSRTVPGARDERSLRTAKPSTGAVRGAAH